MTQRERFEAWAEKKGLNLVYDNGRYKSLETREHWYTWQAASPEGNTPVNGNLLNALRASINGDCYMGAEWEVATIDSMIGKH